MADIQIQQDIVNTLKHKHPPVASQAEAQLEASTEEVWEMIQDFFPDETFSLEQCYQLLLDAGYQMDMQSGKMKMVWLMG